MEHARLLGHHQRPKLQITGMEEGKEIQTKGINNVPNGMITENFPNY
jgi:hypothetical protein